MPAGVLRTLFIALIVSIFGLLAVNTFAQEELSPEPAAEENLGPAVDPITAAEQAILLGEDSPGTAQPIPGTSVWGIIRVILTLAVVAVAIYGIVFFLKRLSRGGAGQDPFLKILASIPLGINRSAQVISVGSKAWLVGISENGVNLIAEIEEKDTLDAMLLENSRKDAEVPGRRRDFKSLLRRLGMPVESKTPNPENIRKQSERLKGL